MIIGKIENAQAFSIQHIATSPCQGPQIITKFYGACIAKLSSKKASSDIFSEKQTGSPRMRIQQKSTRKQDILVHSTLIAYDVLLQSSWHFLALPSLCRQDLGKTSVDRSDRNLPVTASATAFFMTDEALQSISPSLFFRCCLPIYLKSKQTQHLSFRPLTKAAALMIDIQTGSIDKLQVSKQQYTPCQAVNESPNPYGSFLQT